MSDQFEEPVYTDPEIDAMANLIWEMAKKDKVHPGNPRRKFKTIEEFKAFMMRERNMGMNGLDPLGKQIKEKSIHEQIQEIQQRGGPGN